MRHLLTALLLAIAPLQLQAETIRFSVQPILEKEQTLSFYQPLVEYLESETGLDIQLFASVNFLTYWQQMLGGEYDMVLDAAHFTDYRIENLDYYPIAKVPGTVSYSLVTGQDLFVFEPSELIGRKVATAAPPSMGMVRLQELFTNPLRQPVIVESNNMEKVIAMVESGKVDAAIVPTPLLNNYPDLNVVTTTEPAPHVTFSVSPNVSEASRQKLQDALLQAASTDKGQAMLQKINFGGVEKPDPEIYSGFAGLLSETWGY
jgi:phosphonate transport system substrate-binding protein